MVLLCIRRAADPDAPPFLCSALTSSPIQAVIDHVVDVHNMRLRLETARHGEVGEKRPHPEDDAAADDMLSAQSVKRKLVLSTQTLRDAVENLQPGSAERVVAGELRVEAAELLFAGRTLQPDKLLSEYVGKNEKSQVQIQLAGSAVPAEAVGLEAPQPSRGRFSLSPQGQQRKRRLCSELAPDSVSDSVSSRKSVGYRRS